MQYRLGRTTIPRAMRVVNDIVRVGEGLQA